MKRFVQQEVMRQKIIESAIIEFAQHDYNSASINHICERAEISKGIIYHYFKNKDSLYLTCFELCVHDMLKSSINMNINSNQIQENIAQHMKNRAIYFQENPAYKGLFFHAILRTPASLKKEILSLKKEIDTHTLAFFKDLLTKNTLNNQITMEYAIQFLTIQLHMFYEYFQTEIGLEQVDTIAEEYETQVNLWLRILLYGIVKEEPLHDH